MAAALGIVLRIEPKVKQRVVVRAGNQHDIPAPAAIAARRAAARDVFLAPKREAAIAAVTGFHPDSYFVDKHEINNLPKKGTARSHRSAGPGLSRTIPRDRCY